VAGSGFIFIILFSEDFDFWVKSKFCFVEKQIPNSSVPCALEYNFGALGLTRA